MEDFQLFNVMSLTILAIGSLIAVLAFLVCKFIWNPSRTFWQRAQYVAVALVSLSFITLAVRLLPNIKLAWKSLGLKTTEVSSWQLFLLAAILLQVLVLFAGPLPSGVRLKKKTGHGIKGTETDTSTNAHIDEYLTFYLASENKTDFAVMINGVWGIGKTTYIKEKLKKWERKVIYVSLNGVSDQKQISQLILTQIYPILGSKVAKVSSRLLAGALRFEMPVEPLGANANLQLDTAGSGDASGHVFDTQRQDCIYIFDDLERTKLSPIEILGFVNHYVEHENLKVILIANEAHLLSEIEEQNQAYKIIKEKTVGQTLTFQPNGIDTYRAIISELLGDRDDEVSRAIREHTLEIYAQFSACEEANLRSLRQVLLICRRIFYALDEHLVIQPVFALQVIQITIVLRVLVSRGKLEKGDLAGSVGENVFSIPDDEVDPVYKRVRQVEELLPQTDSNLIFGHSFWNELIFEGKLNAVEMNKTAKSYIRPIENDTPTWYRLWHLGELSEDTFNELKSKAIKEFNDDSSDFGYMDVLQTAGILIELAEKELLEIQPDQVEQRAKAYLDLLLKTGKIPPDYSREYTGLEDVVTLGVSLRGRRSRELQSIFRYFEEKQEESRNNDLKRLAKELPAKIKYDFQFIYRKFHTPGETPYIDYPILVHVNVGKLVTAFENRSVGDELQTFIRILRKRYHGAPKTLIRELYFLEGLRDRVRGKYGDDVKTLTAVIWREGLQNIINPVIEKLKRAKHAREREM